MKKNLFWLFIAASTGIFSCKKDGSNPNPPSSVSYLSIAAGNSWNYENTGNPSSTPVVTAFTITSSSRDTSINSKSYHVFSRTDALGAEYYYINTNDYYEYLRLPVLDTIKTENLFLKSNFTAGQNWSQDLAPVTYTGVTAVLTKYDTVIETNMTKTVKGISYDSVIHVRGGLKIKSITPAIISPTLTSTIDNYYAPRVGKIYTYINVHLTNPLPFLIDEKFENKAELVSTNF